MNIFSRLKDGLSKTRNQISEVVEHDREVCDDFYESIEDALIMADVGSDLSADIIERLKNDVEIAEITSARDAYEMLKRNLVHDLLVTKDPDDFPPKPWTIMMIGVNGVGKTTTMGKIAKEYRDLGKSVVLSAADTFRAGAIEQLKVWADRTDSDFVAQHEGADAASVVFDGMEAAKSRGHDVMMIDTAGRLHNKTHLMVELEKIIRVLKKSNPWTPNEVLLVIDATTGQNAIKQAEVFNKIIGVTGFVVTKLDGTSKGGIALALTRKFGIPVRKIGVGEGMEDLQDFEPKKYIEAMFGDFNPIGE
jgi:fused signal recognition particle receptor